MKTEQEIREELEELNSDLKANAQIYKIKMRDIKEYSIFDYQRGKIEALKWVLKEILEE